MTPPSVLDYVRTLPGRCQTCGWHIEKQGHAAGCTEGETLRDEGMARAEQAHPDEAARVDAVIAGFAATRRPFSANDVRPHLRGIKGGVVGARFNAAHRRGLIAKTGERVKSSDPGTHAHEIAVWSGT